MTRFGWIVVLGVLALLVVVLGGVMWLQVRTASDEGEASTLATSTPVTDPSNFSIYTNGEYGFSFLYPSGALLADAFSSTTNAGTAWRTNAVAQGTPIVRVDTGTLEVRIGLSTAPRELAGCLTAGAAEQAHGSITVGSTTWKEFIFEKLGTDNERNVTSYRTLHDKSCFALEIFEPIGGEASSTGYAGKDAITSFNFAR